MKEIVRDANMQMKRGGRFFYEDLLPVRNVFFFTPSLLILIKACKPHLYKSNKFKLAAPVNGHPEQEISARVKISPINSVQSFKLIF